MRLGLMPAVMALAWVPFLPGGSGTRSASRSQARALPRALAPLGRRSLVALAFALVLAENAASTLRARAAPDLPGRSPVRSRR
jgi:hypothetical protein